MVIRFSKKNFWLYIALGLFSTTSFPFIKSNPQPILYQAKKVIRVIDGDTIVIEGNVKVRYIGMNTAELKDKRQNVGCYATEAKAKNEQLVLGKTVFLEKDVSETDKYGRLLRYVYLSDPNSASDASLMVNEYLIKTGYANVATYPPDVKYVARFKASQQEARAKNLGLWENVLKIAHSLTNLRGSDWAGITS